MTATSIADKYTWGTGRRKSSVARVRIRRGEGKIKINDREMTEYFTTERTKMMVYSPLKETKMMKKYDVFVNVRGGGVVSQAGAIIMGLSRALSRVEPETEEILRKGGFLTRDSRQAERKKPGKKGARKSFQFSKR
ncbi:MAG: 30S ribosomal protein S9 [Planctomycetes bacterium]|nr:30S ribosomal protein S9 [Planctomycetota bacterium]